MGAPSAGRMRRLAEELEESGLRPKGDDDFQTVLLEEIDIALRPPVHERRVPSSGTILDPASDPTTWSPGTELEIMRGPLGEQPLKAARRFTDGLSSWLLRRTGHGPGPGAGAREIDGVAVDRVDGLALGGGRPTDEWMVFDRPAGSERDLVVLAGVLDATLVQRHPVGSVRVVGDFGVLRWEGFRWHHEPPVRSWIDAVTACTLHGNPDVLAAMLEFAVHDLGSLGIGALLVYRPDGQPGPTVEERLPIPPPLRVRRAAHLAPLRHALAQIDGAAIFDADGVLRQLGVRLVPSRAAEQSVEPLRGTRHTSGRRYSRDDPWATVIAVSEDGPVSVFRNGEVLGRSAPPASTDDDAPADDDPVTAPE